MDSSVQNIRVFYKKKSRAKYISHLDVTRLMQRAIKRADLPVWYTEGFNPHIYLTFALPLSLGYESESESMDLRLISEMPFDEVARRLNLALPADIEVYAVATPIGKPEVIKSALYDIVLKSDTTSGQTLKECLDNFLSQEKIEVVKKSKKLSKVIDIKEDIHVLSLDVNDNCVDLKVQLTAGISKNINPTLMLDEYKGKYSLEDLNVSVMRRSIFDEQGKEFR